MLSIAHPHAWGLWQGPGRDEPCQGAGDRASRRNNEYFGHLVHVCLALDAVVIITEWRGTCRMGTLWNGARTTS